MSTFPQRVDSLSYVPAITPNEHDAPSALIGAINDSLMAIESHIGFSLATGGDIRPDGTAVSPGPGRRLLPLSGTWSINAAQESLYSVFAPLAQIVSSLNLRESRAVGLLNATPQTPDLFGIITSPLFVRVRRRRNGQPLTACPVLNATGEVLIAITVPYASKDPLAQPAFFAGELLDVFVLLWGGA